MWEVRWKKINIAGFRDSSRIHTKNLLIGASEFRFLDILQRRYILSRGPDKLIYIIKLLTFKQIRRWDSHTIFPKPTLRKNDHEIIVNCQKYHLKILFLWWTIMGMGNLYFLLKQPTTTHLYLSYQYKKYLLILACLVANWCFCPWLGFILFLPIFF